MIHFQLKMILLLTFLFVSSFLNPPQVAEDKKPRSEFAVAESLVADLYSAVTFDSGGSPDWDYVRSMFVNEAVITMRTSRDSSTTFSVNGFIADFINFIRNSPAAKIGFSEKIIRMRPMVFGDIAHVLVLYEAAFPGLEMRPQQGVDSFQLIRKKGRWWIMAIANDIVTRDRPIPHELQK